MDLTSITESEEDGGKGNEFEESGNSSESRVELDKKVT